MELKILQLFSTDHDINIYITTNNQNSVSSIMEIEDFIRRNDNICILQRTQHWKIIINYNLNTGKSIQRVYEGQNFRAKLCEDLLTIKEVSDELKNSAE